MTTDRKSTTKTGTNAAETPAAAPGHVPAQARQKPPAQATSDADVADFVRRMKSLTPQTGTSRGRLIFAMDATMSRQPTWDMALALQADMFHAVKAVGGLDVQLVYFRGTAECRASRWVSDPEALAALMTRVHCAGGFTQIGKVLSHARAESGKKPVNALVYVGDCMEEDIDDLCGRAGELALLGAPVFLFQEGVDARAEKAFREIARLTKGAYCRFDAGSAAQLKELLSAVAVYAAGGRKALEALSGRGVRALLQQLK
ncbi:MAG TPA: VWA domain-containing protein [Hyphomicrobiaceae bacterium]|nr:VWA domain-containing protein [Hyphomicrobiaceae bacterium]